MRWFAGIGLAALLMVVPAHAETIQATLDVAMTCPVSDPPVIETALTRITGVDEVVVSYEDKTAVVTFDDTATNVAEFVEILEELGLKASEHPMSEAVPSGS